MRILFTTHPGYGHFHPLVPMARALMQAGHVVAFATGASFQQAVEDNGFKCFRTAGDFSVIGPKAAAAADAPLEERLAFMAELFVNQLGRHALPDLIQIAQSFSPQLIVRDSVEFAGCVAAEHLGLPHASIQVGAGVTAQLRSRVVTQKLEELRKLVGLPPDPGAEMVYRYLHLSFIPPRYHKDPKALPQTAHSLRPVLFDQSGREGLPGWASQLGGKKVVYVTLGTVFNKVFEPFIALTSALRDEPIELIVTVGRDIDPVRLGAQPDNVHIERYIPQTLILPKCDVAVVHGGWGSMLAALCHGLPMLIVPIAADQPINAARCSELGVAKVLKPTELAPEAVRAAVRSLLTEPSYRTEAQRFQAEAQALPGIAHAVALLERLAAEKSPQLAPA
jgi:UDP:flavonoid glycosyltransferase YjiC (YdhE family)